MNYQGSQHSITEHIGTKCVNMYTNGDKQSLFHQQINSGHLRFGSQMDHKKTCLLSHFLNCKILKKGIVDIYIYIHIVLRNLYIRINV